MPWLETTSDGTLLHLRIIPRAARDMVQGPLGDRLKIRLQAPPVEGKANKALLKFLSRRLGVPTSRLSLVAGAGAREKTVLVEGLDAAGVERNLRPDGESSA